MSNADANGGTPGPGESGASSPLRPPMPPSPSVPASPSSSSAPQSPPPESPPPESVSPIRSAEAEDVALPEPDAARGPSLPPPPPTRAAPAARATPADNQPAASNVGANATSSSGVGSAKGIRWRGELDGVASAPSEGLAESDEAASEGEPKKRSDVVVREAPPWLVSMVFHLVLLLILALVSTPAGQSIGRVVLSIAQGDQQSPVELAEFAIAEADVSSEEMTMDDSLVDVEVTDVFESADLSEVQDVVSVDLGMAADIIPVKPMFTGRTGAMKEMLLKMYGGTPKTQEAVELGLEWLKRNQKKNGRWSMRGPYSDGGWAENEVAATSMALLAFLGDGHTHKKGAYADVVENGMRFLLKQQDQAGFFAAKARGNEKCYAQAQATIAVCELYAMTKDSALRSRAQQAINYALEAQSSEGGWRYYPHKNDSDTSVTGWFVMALESGRAAGLEVDLSVLGRVERFLDSVSQFAEDTPVGYDGAVYAYMPQHIPSASMTAVGLLCRQYLGWERSHPALRRGIETMTKEKPFSMDRRDVYYWYYATQVLHHTAGREWDLWNGVMREQLPEAQVKKGRDRGSWAPQADPYGNFGRLYTTCLSIYCLEVYYRHMPLYRSRQ